MANLRETFQKLPPAIKDWLTSDRTTYAIIDFNKRLNMEGELTRILPTLILRLAVKDLKPENFIGELSFNFDLSFEEAAKLAREIEEKIFKGITNQLRQLGVDIKLIYAAQPPQTEVKLTHTPTPVPGPMPKLPTPPPPKPIPEKILLQTKEAAHPEEGAIATEKKEIRDKREEARPAIPVGEQPFIIYKERPELRETPAPAPKSAPIIRPSTPTQPPRASIRPPEVKIPIKALMPNQTVARPTPPPTPSTRPTMLSSTDKPMIRLVHYNNLRTPLNPKF